MAGKSYVPQLKGLKRGVHVVVGTPGRVMDHMKRGMLKLDTIRFIVLDEGDEMLQMGFVDAIEWILKQAPPQRQIALFSATLPPAIRRIAHTHMREPAQITIQNRASTTPKIRQRYWLVSGLHKLDALTRVLEAERFEAMLIFVRTKLETTALAERLEARGFNVAALHGDIPQQQRERAIARLKAGQVDIVVATDVAARGLDVERISHVVNYDIPYDSQTYVHRIGRTGRAGRKGEAILFVAPRERNMLRIIERATRQPIEQMQLPSVADVNEQRVLKFKETLANAVHSGEGKVFQPLIEDIEREQKPPRHRNRRGAGQPAARSGPILTDDQNPCAARGICVGPPPRRAGKRAGRSTGCRSQCPSHGRITVPGRARGSKPTALKSAVHTASSRGISSVPSRTRRASTAAASGTSTYTASTALWICRRACQKRL